MFDLKNKIKEKLNSTCWNRGALVYNVNLVGDIFIEERGEEIKFLSYVKGSSYDDYETEILIDKKTKKISHSCDCPSYFPSDGCKHVAALARKIDDEYIINDSLEIISKKDGVSEESKMDDEMLEEIMVKTGIPIHTMSRETIDFLKAQLKIELSSDESGKFAKIIEEKTINNKSNKLSIFSKLKSSNSKKENEKNLFKIKLDFERYGFGKNKHSDIKLGVYKCKILKNGNLSSGKKLRRDELEHNDIPKNIKKLKFFLDEPGDYWTGGESGITFLDNPEFFLTNLFKFDKVYSAGNNKLLNIDKNIYDLKISIKKAEPKQLSIGENNLSKNYEIKLVLNTNKGEIFFNNLEIIGEKNNENFACLTNSGELFFFKSDLNYEFINELNTQNLLLNQEEYKELQSSKYFENIIKYSNNVDDLGLKKIKGEPKGKVIVEIDKDFKSVKIKVGINYGKGNDIFLENFKKVDFFVDKEKNIFFIIERNKQEEKNILEQLNDLKNISDEEKDFGFVKVVDDNIDIFFDEIEKLIEKKFIVEYAQKTKRISNSELGLKIDVKSGVDFFDTKTALMLGNKEIKECAELLSLISQSKNQKSITLKNGMTILLKKDLTKSLDLLGEIGISDKDIGKENVSISKHNIGLLKEKKLKGDLIKFSLDKETLKLKKSLSNFSGIRKVKVPENLKAELRDYQQVGYNWMNFLEKYHFSGILADDMGLGKTLQTLTLLQKIYNTKIKQKSLIICPTSLVFNWLDEAEKFTPDLKIEYIKDSKTAFSNIKKETQVVIVSYGIIANLVEKGQLKEKFYYLILDESQNIKNPVAKRTKSICKITSKYRLALSGTPIENNLMELWSVFNFLMPGFLGSLSSFKSKYIGANADKEAIKNLSAKVKPFILRRKKEDVLTELPPKIEEVIKLEMLPKQKEFYTKLKNAFKLQINKELEKNGLNKARFKVLDSLLKLRQACLTPQLINNSEPHPNPLQGEGITSESIKLDYLKETIGEMLNNGHKLLIFSQFTGFLKYVKEILEEKKIEYNYLDGQTKSKDRKGLVDDFNNGKKQVFIISLKAGGTGLNLTEADYVIHLDPWWNPAVENQATDRAHRMGQKKTVFVQKLICRDSIEEKILELQEKKKKLIDDVFSGNFSGSLSKEDIDFIFE